MQNENKDLNTKANWVDWLSFVFATLCTIPFVAIFCIWLIDVCFKTQEQLPGFLIGFLMFEWPVLLVLAIFGIISIVVAWSVIPRVRPLLVFYAVAIVGFVAWFLIGLESMGGDP